MAENEPKPLRSSEVDNDDVKTIKTVWYNDWVKENIGDFTGKVAIVTGSNSGTGFWCAKALAGSGATVVMACRTVAKAEAAKEEILEDYPDARLDVIRLDNADLSSVREFADAFTKKYDRLDLLVNNAGIMAVPYSNTTDGFEVQWQTNHLSHFLLTKLLWETMVVKTPGQSRVIQHSSGSHYLGSPYFNKDHMEKPQHSAMGWPLWHIIGPYMMNMPTWNWLRYGVSKVSNVLFMRGLEKRIKETNIEDKIISVAVHPGYAKTNLAIVAEEHKSMGNLAITSEARAQSAADGSLPLLMACVSNEVVNGDYLGPKDSTKGPPVKDKVGGYGNDKKQASDLWLYSEECIGEKFEI